MKTCIADDMLEYIKAQISLSWQRRVTGTIDIMLYFFLFLLFGVSVSDLGSYLYDLGVEVIPYFLQPMNASVSHEIISKLGKTLVDLSAFPHPTPQWSWNLSTAFLFVFFPSGFLPLGGQKLHHSQSHSSNNYGDMCSIHISKLVIGF